MTENPDVPAVIDDQAVGSGTPPRLASTRLRGPLAPRSSRGSYVPHRRTMLTRKQTFMLISSKIPLLLTVSHVSVSVSCISPKVCPMQYTQSFLGIRCFGGWAWGWERPGRLQRAQALGGLSGSIPQGGWEPICGGCWPP